MAAESKSFFGPLTLHESKDPSIFKSSCLSEVACPLCDSNYSLPEEETSLVTHLFMKHRLVIADFNQIADVKAYLAYWKLRFKDENLPHFCTTMLLDEKPDGTKSKNEEYYLLSDVLPEDKELREHLQQTRLENLLKQHQVEREEKNFEKECLFCRFVSKDTRANYLKHLYEKHNFHVARPENLIFMDELIATISKKLDNLKCIFCEKVFKDRVILKEHMRKKGHKRINPDNKEYDKYFLVNYLDSHKTKTMNNKNSQQPRQQINNSNWRSKTERKDDEEDPRELDSNVESDPEWSDWTESSGPLIVCLFCKNSETEYIQILSHMEREHTFSFNESTVGLSFYHKIKIVNFIRRQVHLKQCLKCDVTFDDVKNLEKHLKESNHFVLEKVKWDQPEFYFSTYEDDLFLCFIEDDDESWWSADEKDDSQDRSDEISKEMAMAVLED